MSPGLIYLIATIVIIAMMIRHIFERSREREKQRAKEHPPTPIYDFEGPRVGPWAYFADEIAPRKFKSHSRGQLTNERSYRHSD